MIYLIAHRGNLTGKNPEKENHPDYIDEAIDCGYDVEIDVWDDSGKLVLGHEVPQYEIDIPNINSFYDFCIYSCRLNFIKN